MNSDSITKPCETLSIRKISMETYTDGIKGFIQKARDDAENLINELRVILQLSSINDIRFHVFEAERKLEKIKHNIEYAKTNLRNL